MAETKFYARRDDILYQTISLYCVQTNEIGKKYTLSVVHSDELNETVEPYPLLRIYPEEAQGLMDQLWDCGLRPSEGSGSAGAMAATERHLKDLQKYMDKVLDKALGE